MKSEASFSEIKQQLISRQKSIIERTKKHDLDISDYIYKTYHKFFDTLHKSKYKYYRGPLCDVSPFKTILKILESNSNFCVINIHQFEKNYEITYIDLEKLNSVINEIKQNQQIEVEIQ